MFLKQFLIVFVSSTKFKVWFMDAPNGYVNLYLNDDWKRLVLNIRAKKLNVGN